MLMSAMLKKKVFPQTTDQNRSYSGLSSIGGSSSDGENSLS